MKKIWLTTIAISIILGTARAQKEKQFGRFDIRVEQKTVVDFEPT